MFQECFKGVPRKIEGCFNRVLSGFQIHLKKVQRVFEENFKCTCRKFQGSFMEVSAVFQGGLNSGLRDI